MKQACRVAVVTLWAPTWTIAAASFESAATVVRATRLGYAAIATTNGMEMNLLLANGFEWRFGPAHQCDEKRAAEPVAACCARICWLRQLDENN